MMLTDSPHIQGNVRAAVAARAFPTKIGKKAKQSFHHSKTSQQE